jgi:NTE family protein
VDWVDEADGVFRGGGVKGLALAGALCGFAEHPTKPVKTWKNVAGASAGAIIACYLATGHSASDMLELLKKTNFSSFADFPAHQKLLGAGRLPFKHGMASGRAFESWFDEVLEGTTFGPLRKPSTNGDTAPQWSLKLIAVDVTKRRLLVLPDDLVFYREPGKSALIDPDSFKVARAARMSMSIPYFFDPVRLEDQDGTLCTIVDGGTLSNFPVWLFDVDPAVTGKPPERPTFGFTLMHGRGLGGLGPLQRVEPWGLRFAFDIFHTAQEAWDSRFVSHSTRVRTVTVDAGDVATTEFNLSPAKQEMLIDNGRAAARAFLDQFELASYMNTFHAALAPPASGNGDGAATQTAPAPAPAGRST